MAMVQWVLMSLPGTKGKKLVHRKTLIFCPDKLKMFYNPYLHLGNGFWS